MFAEVLTYAYLTQKGYPKLRIPDDAFDAFVIITSSETTTTRH